jgi:hypothetical protein
VLADYHLRVGQVTRDTRLPEGCVLVEQRLDETQTGEATTVTLINATRPAEQVKSASAREVAGWLGLDSRAGGLVAWDVYDAVLSPGDIILMLAWRDHDAAHAFEKTPAPDGTRLRTVRVVRDYGMYDRRENPQYYPDAEPRTSNEEVGR